MVRFGKINNDFWVLTIFAKHSILEAWHDFKYASELFQMFFEMTAQNTLQITFTHSCI